MLQQNGTNLFKIAFLIVAHLLLIVAAIVGYKQIYLAFHEITLFSNIALSNIIENSKALFHYLMALDTYMLMGTLFTAGLLSYDITMLGKWACSFKFTKDTKCNKCSRRLIREPRQPIDRFISFIIPLMRFRCVACNDEYLVIKKSKKPSLSEYDIKYSLSVSKIENN